MLLMVSLIMVLVYSTYFFVSSRSEKGNGTLSNCVPMILGMTSSITIGLVIAILLPKMLAVTTILSIIVSAGIACLIGSRFGVRGIIESQASSLMGAMMGAMLGVMLAANEITLMVMTMDVIYLVSICLMMLLLSKDSMVKKQNIFKSKPATFYLVFLLSICLIGITGFLQKEDTQVEVNTMSHMHEH
ncbi:hypothetical protein FB550_106147 [Neobacillus bataviensis]|uniref:Uncharacterized protein n=1 Tax=Neobacillus bataviensis TaxID=220685 RepID=A0A561DCM9_9BACI|nr:hypothetical protein [Neobacillus bataviensis]TWE01093.1 hypothetical protein FB550_106147 [Neobacillus bataviensis]